MGLMDKEAEIPTSIEEEQLRGISRSVGEIEWLLLVVVLLYHAFGGTDPDDRPGIVLSMVLYAMSIMGLRYATFFKRESRWKLAVETWIMTAFITWALLHTGRLDSPLLNSYLLIIITSALALGKLTTLLELALIAVCFVLLGGDFTLVEIISLKYLAGIFAQFAPLVLVAYITTMFASDIRYGLNQAKFLPETDEVTEALSGRGFAIIADSLFGQAVRYDRAITLLVIECDTLKQVNDDHGHKAGDALLMSLVKCIQGQLRRSDVLARQSGEEFVVLLPETPAAGAINIAEKIRVSVATSTLTLIGRSVTTTVSIGTASYPQDGNNLDLLLAQATRNLYKARRAGSNRIQQSAS
ncbi:MAG: GGDEF domain-containing protein [Rhodocyclales bacterium]|nr:GGDEF domain-containing protein [Rhodocyclales bacterium]